MTYVGILADGAEVRLPQPVQVRLSREEDAPADVFAAVFPLERSVGNVVGVRIYDANTELCFEGITDEQKEACSNERLLFLTARSRDALLLDNEAVPQTYCMPSLSTIFVRHVQPYGFSGFRGVGKMFPGELAVTKGMSEWQAAALFCSKFLKVKPRIHDGVFDASGELPEGELIFNNGGDIPYSSITVRNRYSVMISQLLAQSGENGAYRTVAKDSAAEALGVRRRRCLSAGQNAENVLRTARRKSFSVELSCPGEVPGQLLQSASVRGLELSDGLYVSEMEYTLNSDGESTRFVLRERNV